MSYRTNDDPMKCLSVIQEEIRIWTKQFGDNTSCDDEADHFGETLGCIPPFYGMVEELGELSHVDVYRMQGRGDIGPEEAQEKRRDALGDLLTFACDYANRNHIDLLEAFNEVWQKVANRRRESWNADKAAE